MDTGHFDGACEPGNPGGTGAWGFVIEDDEGCVIGTGSGTIPPNPRLTNNVAEYGAAIKAVLHYKSTDRPGPLLLRGDSQLVVKQMQGQWGIKSGYYAKAARKLLDILDGIAFEVQWEWVPRDENEAADKLTAEALAAVGIQRRERPDGGADVTTKQRAFLSRLGVTDEPRDRKHASALISEALAHE
jgi:ribonuclease HI